MARKLQRLCEGCRHTHGARFRTVVSVYLCEECYEAWQQTGEIPGPQLDEPEHLEEQRRW